MMHQRFSRAAALVLLILGLASPAGILAQPAAAQALNLQDAIPFDSAIHTAALPNGLKYFVRRNARPENRLSLRLAVKAGSLDEADDQQGLAHFI